MDIHIEGKIGLIRVVRTGAYNLTLVEAKVVVEKWLEVWNTDVLSAVSEDALVNLLRLAGKVDRGEWIVSNEEILLNQPTKVSREMVQELPSPHNKIINP